MNSATSSAFFFTESRVSTTYTINGINDKILIQRICLISPAGSLHLHSEVSSSSIELTLAMVLIYALKRMESLHQIYLLLSQLKRLMTWSENYFSPLPNLMTSDSQKTSSYSPLLLDAIGHRIINTYFNKVFIDILLPSLPC